MNRIAVEEIVPDSGVASVLHGSYSESAHLIGAGEPASSDPSDTHPDHGETEPIMKTMPRMSLWVCLWIGLLAAGCSKDTPDASVERITEGDTTIVRHLGGEGAWGAPMTFVEELSIGALEGEAHEMFGRILGTAVDAAGGIYVFDGQYPALRYFDAEGTYVRTLGGQGQGPGEYEDAALGLEVRSDGRLVLRDPRNRRLTLYNPDGSFSENWPLQSGLFMSTKSTFLDRNDHLYLVILTGRPEQNKPWPFGLLHLDAAGAVVDTIPQPVFDGFTESAGGHFLPKTVWTVSPLGYVVAGFNSEYAFTLLLPEGKMLRVERRHEPVAVAAEERAQLEELNAWVERNQGQNLTAEIPAIPRIKPAYKDLRVDDDGRIWVHLHQPGVNTEPDAAPRDPESPPRVTWREPNVFDVYEPDGAYLGRAELSEAYRLEKIRGDTAWAIKQGESGEQYVVQLRMTPGGAN